MRKAGKSAHKLSRPSQIAPLEPGPCTFLLSCYALLRGLSQQRKHGKTEYFVFNNWTGERGATANRAECCLKKAGTRSHCFGTFYKIAIGKQKYLGKIKNMCTCKC